MNIQIEKFVYRSDLETTILLHQIAYFLSKRLNYTAINLFFKKMSTLTFAKISISTGTDITLQTIVKNLRATKMCSASTPDCGYENSTLLLALGTCIVWIQRFRVNFACTKRLFNHSAEAIINFRNARLCARCSIFLLKIKLFPFSCRLGKGFTFLKRVQKQLNMLLELCINLASIVSTERNANLLTFM